MTVVDAALTPGLQVCNLRTSEALLMQNAAMKILIVEDEAKTGDYLKQGLSEAGFTADLVRNGLDGMHEGLSGDHDLLILDVPSAATDSPDRAEIMRRDRTLARKRGGDWQNAAFRFLTGPLRRNLDHIGDIQIQTELDQASCVIPGSYAIVHNALVKLQSGEEKHFVIGYSKRYLLAKLATSMKGEGWTLVNGFHYGADNYGLLAIFQRHKPQVRRKRTQQ